MSVIGFILDLKKLKLEKLINELLKVGFTIAAAFVTYKAIAGIVSFVKEESFSSRVLNEASRIKDSKDTAIIEYFYQQDKENTCKTLILYLDIYKGVENVDIIRLEVFPKYCSDNTKEIK
jgi:hypothetical protein